MVLLSSFFNWVITNAAHLMSLLSSVMLLVCTQSITSFTSLVLQYQSINSSYVLRVWQVIFVHQLNCFFKYFSFLYCVNIVELINFELIKVLNFPHPSLRPPHSVQYVVLSPIVQVQSLFSFALFVEFQHYSYHFLQVSLSPLIAVVTANLSFESFALDQTTFALLLEVTLSLSKKHVISVYILSHLADFDSRMSLLKYYLESTTFFGLQLDDDRVHAPNHEIPVGQEIFIIHSSLIHTIIRYISIGHFTLRGK